MRSSGNRSSHAPTESRACRKNMRALQLPAILSDVLANHLFGERTMQKRSRTRNGYSFAKLALKLCIIAILVEMLLLTPPSRATSRFSCTLGTFGGITRTVSCGSSAGNFIIGCTGSSCIDETGTDPTNQSIANQLCEQYEREGCPPPLTGEPFPDTTLLTQ